MVIKKTNRNFPYVEFYDRYDQKCSIQKSSLAFEDCIWFGLDSANPQVMAKDAEAFGLDPIERTGWIPYPIPQGVILSTRMHLTQDQVKAILPILQRFSETGQIE